MGLLIFLPEIEEGIDSATTYVGAGVGLAQGIGIGIGSRITYSNRACYDLVITGVDRQYTADDVGTGCGGDS